MTKIKSLFDLPATRGYLNRVGAEPRSLKAAVIRETSGKYWKDLGVIRFDKTGEVTGPDQYMPTDAEATAIRKEFASVEFPEIKPLHKIVRPPPDIANADPKDIFEFREATGEHRIIMIHVRVEREEGKNYLPWTYWSDDEWRMAEPDGPLPLFGAERLSDAATVFIHEGAKAAKQAQRIANGAAPGASKADRDLYEAHPWGAELAGAVHLGWIGGAMSPYRTDWSVIGRAGVKTAYIVADNDEPGRAAVPQIAQYLKIPTFTIQFTDEFPPSFDLADTFPDNLFGTPDGGRHYIGPTFRNVTHPATWATDLIPNPKGKPTAVLRDSFKAMWAYVEEADVFVCTRMPEIMRSEPILNKMLAAFSHAAETSKLIVKAYRGRSTRICYRPDHPGLSVTHRGSSAINLHVPTEIRSKAGDPKPFLDFLDYMFVRASERKEVARWCATLIARPDLRMGYGLLLISERQGIGKTTLGASILAPLVGVTNVGFPGEADIVSNFNDWIANKRLVIVNEIYSGSSWRAYHALKSVITDKEVSVNQKYMRQYTLENWCHVLACSNSMRALKMENDDRRWMYPEITEVPWPKAKFIEFRRWLEQGGLSIVKAWAEGYGDYVDPSATAPMTDRKREMIEGSRSEAQREAGALSESAADRSEPVALLMGEVTAWIKSSVSGKIFDTDYELRKTMTETGLKVFDKRIKALGRMQVVLMNPALVDQVKRTTEPDEAIAAIRAAIKTPQSILTEVF